MNTPIDVRSVPLHLALTLALMPLLPSLGLAQGGNSESDDDIYELSPFLVDASEDVGYTVTSTLSGTRLNSENRYVGTANTEITEQLLQDLAATNFEDMLEVVPNSAPNQGGGLTQDVQGNEAIFGEKYRVRGFQIGSLSRDFFQNAGNVTQDPYNAQRLTFSRGPNAVLFGLGHPGGITNLVSKRALMADRYELQLRADSEDSRRAVIDVNKVILDGKLAARLIGMSEKRFTNRKPSDEEDERIYFTASYKPMESTTIRASYEEVDFYRLNVRPWIAADAVTPYLEAGSPDLPDTPASIKNGMGSLADNSALLPLGMEIQNNFVGWTVESSNSVAEVPFISRRGWVMSARPAGGLRIAGESILPLNRPDILPLEANVLGFGNSVTQDHENASIFLEHQFTENLSLELAYNDQETEQTPNFNSGFRDFVYIDVSPFNRHPDGTLTDNPNQGRLFMFNPTPVHFERLYNAETLRATIAYELDLRDRFSDRWGSILGHHNFAALLERRESDFLENAFHLRNTTPQGGVWPSVPAGVNNNLRAAHTWAAFRHYIDPNDDSTWGAPAIDESYPFVFAGDPLPPADPSGRTPAWISIFGSNSEERLHSEMIAMQNYFWENRIVTTLGYREDRVTNWRAQNRPLPGVDTKNIGTDVSGINIRDVVDAGDLGMRFGGLSRTDFSGETMTVGIVVTPRKSFSVFYNEADSFLPGDTSNTDIFGNPLPNLDGEGTELGLKFYLFDNKLVGSFSRFETSLSNSASAGLRNNAFAGQFDSPKNAVAMTIREYFEDPAGGNDAAAAARWDGFPFFPGNYAGLQSQDAEGFEFGLTANPTDSWRLMFNLARQENVSSDLAPRMNLWVDEFVIDWIEARPDSQTIYNLETQQLDSQGQPFSVRDLIEGPDGMKGILARLKSIEGVSDARQPEWGANLVTTCEFKEGGFKNWGFGGKVRWRENAIVGYQNLNGSSTAFDTSNPFYGDTEFEIGLWAFRKFKIHDINARIQLNIENVLDDDDVSSLHSVDDGSGNPIPARYGLPQGRTFVLTANFTM